MAITKVSSSLIDANLTITGGTVDDTVIGSGTPAAGTFTTIGGTLASSVTGTTQSAGDNSTKIATTGYVETALANMVDSAPSTLDTLNELAAALGDDANFSTTVTNSIALKAPLANPTFTGSFTSPGIDDNADAIAITIDSSENVGIGTSSVAAKVHIESSSASITPSVHADELLVENNGNAGITIGSSTTGQGRLTFADSGGDSRGNIIYDHSDDSMDFITADSLAMTIDSSGSVGIGTSSPRSVSNYGVLAVNGSSGSVIDFELGEALKTTLTQSSGQFEINVVPALPLVFKTSNSEAMRIDDSGSVGIGAAPNTTNYGGTFKYLGVNAGAGYGVIEGQTSSTTAGDGAASFFASTTGTSGLNLLGGMQVYNYASSASNAEGGLRWYTATGGNITAHMYLDNSGNLQIGSTSADGRLKISAPAGNSASADLTLWGNNSGAYGGTNIAKSKISSFSDGTAYGANLAFYTNDTSNSYQEAMRLTSGGIALFGKTAVDNTTQGIQIDGPSGFMSVARDAGIALLLDRSNDGEIQRFTVDGSTVGHIGTTGGKLYIGSSDGSDAFLRFESNEISPCAHDGSFRDNVINLGKSDSRFDDIHATNGTIQTSDRNEKQDIEALSEAEQRVAVACKGLLRKFRWTSAVEEKGDDARIHFGIIAQDLQDAFTAEGLDAGRYAMFISSTWTDEKTGEERTRLGVRYSELLAFIISAI